MAQHNLPQSRWLRVELLYVRFRTCSTSTSHPPYTPDLGVFGWAREAPGCPGGHLGASRPMLLSRRVTKKAQKSAKKNIRTSYHVKNVQKTAQHGPKDGHTIVQL